MSSQTVLHIRPQTGGIVVYADVISALYKNLDIEVIVCAPNDVSEVKRVINEVSKSCILHFEIGAGDSQLLSISRKLLKQSKLTQLITIHDPGVVVRHAYELRSLVFHRIKLIRLAGKVTRKLISLTVGPALIRRQLSSAKVKLVYLRPDLAQPPKSFYLPHPNWHGEVVPARSPSVKLSRIGFSGFWGLGKGIETLLEAWELLNTKQLNLVISGGAANKGNPYEQTIKRMAKGLKNIPQFSGFVPEPEFDDFLRNLDILILPYWASLPNGTSAMALRAAELGVPVIASDLPALRQQLGDDAAIYVEPQNPQALVAAIEYANKNWEKIQLDIISARERNIELGSWPNVSTELKQIIDQIS